MKFADLLTLSRYVSIVTDTDLIMPYHWLEVCLLKSEQYFFSMVS